MSGKILVQFNMIKSKRTVDIEIPTDITARELIIGLMNFLKNVDGLYDFYTEQDKTFDGSINALKNATGIGKNSKVFSIFDKYGTKTVKTIEDVVGLIGG